MSTTAAGCRLRADQSINQPKSDKTNPDKSNLDTNLVTEPRSPQAISWLGQPLFPHELDESTRQHFEAQLALAQTQASTQSNDPLNHIWLGRRLAYLNRYDEAIQVYTDAIKKFPKDARLYRHRGHRYLTIRKLSQARQDFLKAAEFVVGQTDQIEPDGLPNAQNKPRSTLQGNIYYHLGLVDFLSADFSTAEARFRRALALATNDDSRVAVLNWLHLILRRQGRHQEALTILADVKPKMDVIENEAYHHLLLFYRGDLSREAIMAPSKAGGWQNPAITFALAQTSLINGETNHAYERMHNLVNEGRWDAFGTIAAEAELARRNPLMPIAHPNFDLPSHLAAWTELWRSYDLNSVEDLFLPSARLTYYSSEKMGRMQGITAIVEHHRGFGFVAGGKPATKELWVQDGHAEAFGNTVIVTGTWYFGVRSTASMSRTMSRAMSRTGKARTEPQHGPFTFVYASTPNGYRIAHAHFANDL